MTPFIWTWDRWQLRITASRLHQDKSGVSAECIVERLLSDAWACVTNYRVSLTSISGRRDFIREMKALWEEPDWALVAHTLCVQTLAAWRAGERAQQATGETPLEEGTWILNPLLYAGHTTILYGPGDSGKSTLAILSALLLAQGGC